VLYVRSSFTLSSSITFAMAYQYRGLGTEIGEDSRTPRVVLRRAPQTELNAQLTVYESRERVGTSSDQQLAVQGLNASNRRRRNRRRGYGLFGALIFVLSVGYFFKSQPGIPQTDYAARTRHVMSTTPLIDGHNDMPALIRVELKNHIYDKRFTFREGLLSTTDLVKLRTGRVGGQFWSAFVPCVNEMADDFNVPTVCNLVRARERRH
jgi:hypothetical protein